MVDISRDFIDSAGARHYAEATIGAVAPAEPFSPDPDDRRTVKERVEEELSDANHTSQKGMVEMFDSTVGRSTVLMPYGGMLQTTPAQVSVQKLPVDGYTDTASVMAWGCDPYLGSWSPYHAAAYAVVDACTKVVSAGGRYETMRFSYQEYFQRMTHERHTWGLPLSALLGALKMQVELGLPSIGGKDSMSGTFEDLNVPPTLAAFGITTVDANDVISPELKSEDNLLYLVRHTPKENLMPDTDRLKRNWSFVNGQILDGNIVSAYAVGLDSVCASICKMSFGNAFGVDIKAPADVLFDCCYGSIVVECEEELDYPDAVYLGKVTSGDDGMLHINGEELDIFGLMELNGAMFNEIYPSTAEARHTALVPSGMENIRPLKVKKQELRYKGEPVQTPVAYLPVFPGTNCDYDTAKAFRRAGAEVRMTTFCNLGTEDIFRSIEEMKKNISECHIFALCGGFSAGDEPDGSGKFIANVLNNKEIAEEIHRLLDRGGLILGICNGFQALVKSGLLPYGRLGMVTKDSPTLFRNDINRHISQMVTTRVSSTNSPWLSGFRTGDLHTIAVSHGEGKFVVSDDLARELFANGQVAFQYFRTNVGAQPRGFLPVPETQAQARLRASGASCALVGSSQRHPLRDEAGHIGSRVPARAAAESRVHDNAYAFNGQGGFGNGRGQHDLAPSFRRRGYGRVLFGGLQTAVQRMDVGIRRNIALQLFGDACDFGRAGQKDQQAALFRQQGADAVLEIPAAHAEAGKRRAVEHASGFQQGGKTTAQQIAIQRMGTRRRA